MATAHSSSRPFRSGLTLSNSSELEIRNLLKQVELQVANKKLKWEKQKQESEHRLRVKEQELHKLETTVQEKDAQVCDYSYCFITVAERY